MDGLISTMAQELHRKGIDPELLPGFLKDIKLFIKDNGRLSLQRLNLELEDLGWGIRIIDQQIYDRILQFNNNYKIEVVRK